MATKIINLNKKDKKEKSKINIDYLKAVKSLAILIIVTGIGVGAYYAYLKLRNEEDSPVIENYEQEKEDKTIKYYTTLDTEFKITENLSDLETEKELEKTNDSEISNLQITRLKDTNSGYEKLWTKLYIPVTRYDARTYDITSEDLEKAIITQTHEDFSVIWDSSLNSFLNYKFNSVASQEFTEIEQIHKELIKTNKTIAIIPFNETKKEYKVLKVDRISPFDKDFNKTQWSLSDILWITDDDDLKEIKDHLQIKLGEENYVSEKLHDIIMTGTSVVGARKHYLRIQETGDPLYPIREIAPILKSADIAHLSNEGSFSENCVQKIPTLVFCGTLESFEQFEFAGIDVVGLTGNHIMDYGHSAFLDTLERFNELEITYFGGGENFEDAHTPKIIEVGDTKIAFLGYNYIPPASYLATIKTPGNASSDQYRGDNKNMKKDIENAKEIADIIIIDMQWGDEYTHSQNVYQEFDGRKAIEFGADIINGAHSHVVQGIEYYRDGIIFYGLGNTLFDQAQGDHVREGTMVKHIIYNGEYIGFQHIVTYIPPDIQTELATPERRDKVLNTIYNNSQINTQ